LTITPGGDIMADTGFPVNNWICASIAYPYTSID
jgi:hypothetical protein